MGGQFKLYKNFQTNLGDHPHPASRPMTCNVTSLRGMRTTVATTLAWSTHPRKLVTFLGQIPGQMWEYTNTFVTYDTYGT